MRTVESKEVVIDVRDIVRVYPENDLAQRMADDSAPIYDALLLLLKNEGLKPTVVRFRIEIDGE